LTPVIYILIILIIFKPGTLIVVGDSFHHVIIVIVDIRVGYFYLQLYMNL
jgi:hypothetical protein